EGGMLLIGDEAHWARAWAYKDHGKDPDKVRQPNGHCGYRYLHDSFGSNMRLTELQSAIGRVQLRKLPRWLARRHRNATQLRERLSGHPLLRLPSIPTEVGHAFYKFCLTLETGRFGNGVARHDIIEALNRHGIPAA